MCRSPAALRQVSAERAPPAEGRAGGSMNPGPPYYTARVLALLLCITLCTRKNLCDADEPEIYVCVSSEHTKRRNMLFLAESFWVRKSASKKCVISNAPMANICTRENWSRPILTVTEQSIAFCARKVNGFSISGAIFCDLLLCYYAVRKIVLLLNLLFMEAQNIKYQFKKTKT